MATFEELVAEGDAVPLDGWDFSWFEGRATEERPSWGYARLIGQRSSTVDSMLDVQTGGGEVLATIPSAPATLAATESWPPNLAVARRNLEPLGGKVYEAPDEGPLPFPDASFELVVSRLPTVTIWPEIARVLRPGGSYLSQQVGAGTMRELTDFMMGPQPVSQIRSTDRAREEAEAAGLTVVDLRHESLRAEFFDVGAVVHFLRKVLWTVPGFTVEGYRDRLRVMHEHIAEHGSFVAHSQRFLIEARREA
ncbi:class I SAM-dependent methyltransferase [Allokutzneria albata]|uniref:Methyltransferase domain-containing protein n=1 Tax=Allokutzneria albata TaxID=211114 RepID=A0A1G9RV62_ALLAB|nr:class I SAM-dependent methyltransferase [Allokutzneria albata]SDM27178.1 Methyltransferase domain-containing protein [Allokutzneria albata]